MNTRNALAAGLFLAGLTLVSMSGCAAQENGHHGKEAEEAKITLQATCPVMGGKINSDLYVDHDGQRIYVCCKGCIDTVKKEPETYIKKLKDKGVAVAKVQTTCPVMGGKINKDLYVDHDDQRIYVCCQGCIAAIKKAPEKYIRKLAEKGEVPVSVPEKPKHEDMKHRAEPTGHEGHRH